MPVLPLTDSPLSTALLLLRLLVSVPLPLIRCDRVEEPVVVVPAVRLLSVPEKLVLSLLPVACAVGTAVGGGCRLFNPIMGCDEGGVL